MRLRLHLLFALALVVGVGHAADPGTLAVGSKRFTESYILGEVIAQTAAPTPAEHRPGPGQHRHRVRGAEGRRDRPLSRVHRHDREGNPQARRQARRLAALNRALAPHRPRGRRCRSASTTATRWRCARQRRSGSASARSPISRRTRSSKLGLSQEFIGRADGWPGLEGAPTACRSSARGPRPRPCLRGASRPADRRDGHLLHRRQDRSASGCACSRTTASSSRATTRCCSTGWTCRSAFPRRGGAAKLEGRIDERSDDRD